MWKGDGDGGVREGAGGPPTGGVGDSGKGWCGRPTQGALGFKKNWSRVRAKNEDDFGLKQGNVATLRCNVMTF